MRTIKTWIGLAAAVLLAGCGSTSGTQSAQAVGTTGSAGTQPAIAATDDTCPMQVPGTTVAFADVEGGAALVFTTSDDDVAELRQRVGRMTEMHNRHPAGGGMMMGGPGAGQSAGAMPGYGRGGRRGMGLDGGMGMPAARASVDEVEAGARLVLRPQTPAQLEALRARARAWAGRLAAGECWPMASGAQPQAAVLPITSAADDASSHRPRVEQ